MMQAQMEVGQLSDAFANLALKHLQMLGCKLAQCPHCQVSNIPADHSGKAMLA